MKKILAAGLIGLGLVGCATPAYNYQAIPNLSNIIDMTYLTTFGFRRIGALSSSGEVYIWGVEDNNGSTTDTIYGGCTKTWNSVSYDMCAPVKITSNNSNLSTIPNFKYIRGGIDAFIAKDDAGVYYRIRQEKSKKIVSLRCFLREIND